MMLGLLVLSENLCECGLTKWNLATSFVSHLHMKKELTKNARYHIYFCARKAFRWDWRLTLFTSIYVKATGHLIIRVQPF